MSLISKQKISSVDFKSWTNAESANGIISGLSVAEDSPTGMSVIVGIGSALVGNTKIEKTSSTELGIDTAPIDYPRKDIVVLYNTGTLSVVKGTPRPLTPYGETGVKSSSPYAPDIPSDSILLAEVWVDVGVSEITNSDIADKRLLAGCQAPHASNHPSGQSDAITSPLVLASISSPLTHKITTRVQAGIYDDKPTGVNAGDIYYDTTNNFLWIYDGSNWR